MPLPAPGPPRTKITRKDSPLSSPPDDDDDDDASALFLAADLRWRWRTNVKALPAKRKREKGQKPLEEEVPPPVQWLCSMVMVSIVCV